MRAFRPALRARIWAATAALLVIVWPAVALASLSQGFATSSTIPPGSLVSLDAKASGSVVVTDLTNVDRLFGVAVPNSSASISLGASSTNGQVQVLTTGSATVLVSTAGGPIRVGDYITVSPIAGVGQKATVGNKVRVIGTAQTDFDGTGSNVTKQSIDTTTGKQEVAIGQIPVEVSVSSYTQDTTQTTIVPAWAQKLAATIAGKAVSPVRIIVAGLILLVAVISVSVLLYAAVRNSIISIGRNPLSRGAVLGGLLQVTLIAALILGVSAAAMYVVIAR